MRLNIATSLSAKISGEIISCNGSGVQAVANHCTSFVNCDRGSGIVQSCGPGTVFHKVGFFEMKKILNELADVG